MKLIFKTLFFFLLIQTMGFSKETVYRFKFGLKVDECNTDGTALAAPTSQTALKGYKFTIDKKNTTDYIITFLKWNENDIQGVSKLAASVNLNSIFYGTDTNRKFFKISINNFDTAVEEVNDEGGFTFGSLSVPIKIRFEGKEDNKVVREFDFSGDINLGLSVGYKTKLSKAGLSSNFLAGVSITQIPVDKSTK